MERLPLRIRGKVIHGDGRGKHLGFPTANIQMRRKVLPDGVYAGYVRVHPERSRGAKFQIYPAMLFFGTPETFKGATYRGEAYLIGFTGNLYGKWITLRPIRKLRSNRKFSSVAALKKQMQKDFLRTQKLLPEIVGRKNRGHNLIS